jgi:chorismate dehydratase
LQKLRIGKISFLNIVPIFKVLEGECFCPEYEYVEGFPTELNRMLRENDIEISPSSSVEYLQNKEEYTYLDGHSISAEGSVRSILLFSRIPIENLGGHDISATHKSATSVSLLKIILSRFYKLDFKLTVTESPVEDAIDNHSAYLAIGDEAINTSRAALDINTTSIEQPFKLQSIRHQAFYVYDLSDLWYRHTGLPMVFALWTIKRDTLKDRKIEVDGFAKLLSEARSIARKKLWEFAQTPGLILPPDEAFNYWNDIIYDLPENCKKGLDLFGEYLKELD